MLFLCLCVCQFDEGDNGLQVQDTVAKLRRQLTEVRVDQQLFHWFLHMDTEIVIFQSVAFLLAILWLYKHIKTGTFLHCFQSEPCFPVRF